MRGGLDVVVVGKLRQGEECVPVVLSFSDEEPQVLFQFLVDPFCLSVGLQVVSGRRRGLFCLSVGLRVVSGRRRGFDSQQSVQFRQQQIAVRGRRRPSAGGHEVSRCSEGRGLLPRQW